MNYQVEISNKSYYLCNNIFYYGLKYIEEKELNTQIIFIHVPVINEIDSVDKIAKTLEWYFVNIR